MKHFPCMYRRGKAIVNIIIQFLLSLQSYRAYLENKMTSVCYSGLTSLQGK